MMEKQKQYNAQAVIVGGGMAGLTTATALVKNGFALLLLEKMKAAGARSMSVQGEPLQVS